MPRRRLYRGYTAGLGPFPRLWRVHAGWGWLVQVELVLLPQRRLGLGRWSQVKLDEHVTEGRQVDHTILCVLLCTPSPREGRMIKAQQYSFKSITQNTSSEIL